MKSLLVLACVPTLLLSAGCASEPGPVDAEPGLCELDGGVPADADPDSVVEMPPYTKLCMPPCIWELIRPCSQQRCCIWNGSAGCYSDGSIKWTRVGGVERVYRADGTLCYSIDSSDESKTIYRDGAGELVAEVTYDGRLTVAVCANSVEPQYFNRFGVDCPKLWPREGCVWAELPEACGFGDAGVADTTR